MATFTIITRSIAGFTATQIGLRVYRVRDNTWLDPATGTFAATIPAAFIVPVQLSATEPGTSNPAYPGWGRADVTIADPELTKPDGLIVFLHDTLNGNAYVGDQSGTIAPSVLDEPDAIEAGVSTRGAFRLIQSILAAGRVDLNIAADGQTVLGETYYRKDGTRPAATFLHDANGHRSSMVLGDLS